MAACYEAAYAYGGDMCGRTMVRDLRFNASRDGSNEATQTNQFVPQIERTFQPCPPRSRKARAQLLEFREVATIPVWQTPRLYGRYVMRLFARNAGVAQETDGTAAG